ncbi:MAG TPA: alpha/beta fold hydrolase [Stellaceae bacterium]|jgi:aminoacrylate hydrolase
MPRISIGDCQLYYERHGHGFPVMFASGLGGHASFWREQVPAFARSFDVIVHDQRGIGQSDATRMAYTVEGNATDMIALMDALSIERAHIIGHATGSAVATVLAIEHPERLASVVLSAGWARQDPFLRRVYALRRDLLTQLGPAAYIQASTVMLYPPSWIAKNNEALRQMESQQLAGFKQDIVLSRIDALLAFDRSDELSRIKTPTLVIAAEDDFVIPSYLSEELARLIPGAEAKFFSHGAHCFMQVSPREFNQAVMPFLEQHTPANRR